ncbi:MAG: SBBP repeat-containing protein [bacterium]|nr:SBBP repeat-containing protein [bacterium]
MRTIDITKNILILLVLAAQTFAQQPTVEWTKTYHGPSSGGGITKIIADNNGNIIVTGKNAGSGVALDIVTIKYNTFGDSLWLKRYGNGGESSVDGIAVDAYDNIYVTGFTVVAGQPKSITIKYSPSGNIIWEKLYDSTPDNRSIGVGIDLQGFVYIACSANKNGLDWGVEVVKYDPSSGDTIWTARYDQTSSSVEIPYAMTVDESGNVYVTGYSQASGLIKAMIVKFNSDGDYQWATLYNIPSVTGEIHGKAIKVDSYGNVYATGHCYSGASTFVDFLVMKCYSNGDTAWVKRYSNSFSTDEAKDIAVDNEGNVYVTGRTYVGGGGSNNYDYLTIKLSSDGTVLWHSTYDGPAGYTQDEARALVLDEFGNSFITGGSSVSPLYYSGDFATVMYDENGNDIWTVRNPSGDFGAYDIALDDYNNIYLGGGQTASFCTIKVNTGTVPVELSSFIAHQKDKNVILSWTTATETNNTGFEVERFSSTWEKIGFVPGFGTTTEKKQYAFTDTELKDGKYYNRLRQIDYDGSYEYSNELEVEILFTPNEFELFQNYPNPFNPCTIIEFSLPEDVGSVKLLIYNSLGEKVAELVNTSLTAGKYSYQWNASDVATGMYIYELRTEKFVSVKKMILIK